MRGRVKKLAGAAVLCVNFFSCFYMKKYHHFFGIFFLILLLLGNSCGKDEDNDTPDTQEPTIELSLTVDKLFGQVQEEFKFTLSLQNSSSVEVENLVWNFGDGDSISTNFQNFDRWHTYQEPGYYWASVKAFTADNKVYKDSVQIQVLANNSYRITSIKMLQFPARSDLDPDYDWDYEYYPEGSAARRADLTFSLDKSTQQTVPVYSSSLTPVIAQSTTITDAIVPCTWTLSSSDFPIINYNTIPSLVFDFFDNDMSEGSSNPHHGISSDVFVNMKLYSADKPTTVLVTDGDFKFELQVIWY